MNSYLEQIIFFYIIRDKELVKIFKGIYFNTKQLQILFDIIKPYVLEFGSEPSLDQVRELLMMSGNQEAGQAESLESIWANRDKVDSYGPDWLHENTIAMAQWKNLITGVKKTLTYIKTIENNVSFDNCSDIVNKAKEIFRLETDFTPFDENSGHDFMDSETHEVKESDISKSGYDFIDICLNGGFAKKCLYCFVGGTKTGKSMWLANLCAKGVERGDNCAYVTLELPYNKVAARIGSNLYNIPIYNYNEVVKDKEKFRESQQNFYRKDIPNNPGKLIIYEYPTSSVTIEQIEADLLKTEQQLSTPEKPFKFSKIFIDYLAIMADAKNPRTENTFIKLKNISEATRAAMQRNNWCGITVNQLNRGGLDNANPSMTDMSEGISIGFTVDGLFIIIRTSTMNAQGVYYLKCELARDSEYMGYKKKFSFDKTYLRISETDEQMIAEGIDIPDSAVKASQAVVSGQLNIGIDLNNQPSKTTNLGLSESIITGVDLFKS